MLISLIIIGCFGDKNTLVGQDLGNTDFVNTNFTKNKVAFSEIPKNLCTYVNEADIRELYPDATKILFDDGQTFASKSCRFLVYINEDTEAKFGFLTGIITAVEDKVAEGENWIETWELKKKMSKSSSFVPNLGMAAIWKEANRELSIKMDGYIVTILTPGSPFNKEELEKNRDYKKIALEIAKRMNLF